jgi:prepilin-type N-terminal cleavage/methylation domain-containing protein
MFAAARGLLEAESSKEWGLRARAKRGFTMFEMMIVVAIAAIMVALGYPSWQRMNDNLRLRSAARAAQDTFSYAREQALRTGRRHLVFSQTGPPATQVDACGASIPSPLFVLDDVDLDCCIDAAEPSWSPEELNQPGVQQTAFWGVTNALARVPEDGGAGAIADGSTFTRPTGGATPVFAFRGDGIPVNISVACVAGAVGSGSGGYYFTNGRAGLSAGERRDFAVILTALGTVKVFTWDQVGATWTQ